MSIKRKKPESWPLFHPFFYGWFTQVVLYKEQVVQKVHSDLTYSYQHPSLSACYQLTHIEWQIGNLALLLERLTTNRSRNSQSQHPPRGGR